jgi:hypothetical protein
MFIFGDWSRSIDAKPWRSAAIPRNEVVPSSSHCSTRSRLRTTSASAIDIATVPANQIKNKKRTTVRSLDRKKRNETDFFFNKVAASDFVHPQVNNIGCRQR